MMKEDSAETEAKILAEIKQALGQPPHTITISNSIDIRSIGLFPSSSKSPTKQNDASFECTTSDETGSTDDYEHLPKVEDGNDSFMSSGSSPLQGSQIFYIDTVEEEEASIPRRANNLEVDDMRSRELMQIMERLYDNLRRSDDALSAERELRRSRERNLIKLAKELSWRKERMNKKDSQNKQLKEELRMLRCENLLIKQQLDHQLQTSREKREEEDGTCHDLKRALAEAQALYRSVCEEHEDRTTEMNKAHAKQCEQLCRDVVQAHSEIKRLKNVFPPLTGGSHSIVWSILMLGSSKNSPAKGGRTRYISKRSYLFFLICVGFALYRFNFVPAYKEKETTTDPLNVHELPTSLKALKDTPALALPKIYAKERTEAIELEPENSPKRSIPGSQGKPRLVAWFQSPSQGYYEIHKKGHLEQ